MTFTKKQIENRFVSRRQFLVGAGSALLIPPLASLMPSELQAAALAPKKRFIVQISFLGIDVPNLFPAEQPLANLTQVPGAVSSYHMPLANFGNMPISLMIDSNFQSMYPKMNLIQGLSYTGGWTAGHNNCFLSGWHSMFRNPTTGRTLDVVMEKSPNVYPSDDTPPFKAIRVGCAPDGEISASYDCMTGVKQVSSYFQGDVALFNGIFLNLKSGAGSGSQKTMIVDKVLADFKALQSNSRLSANDKNVLAEYIQGVNDLQTRINNTIVCSAPTLDLQSTGRGGWNLVGFPGWNPAMNMSTLFDNYNQMFKLALACDLTRVIFIGNGSVTDDTPIFQSEHHDAPSSVAAALRQKWGLMKYLKLAQTLDGTADPSGSGTLLDNTFMMYTNELGDWTTGHGVFNLPAVTFGSCGGKFKTGNFMDYRQRPFVNHIYGSTTGPYLGRPYKQLLQSAMLAMGVTKAEYSAFGDGQGYGEFKPDITSWSNIPGAYAAYAGEHNDALPYLYNP